MPRTVFDASAVIAWLRQESGAEVIQRYLDQATISAVNFQEAAKELLEQGMEIEEAATTLAELRLEVLPHDAEDALLAASLAPATKKFGRGLGDRSCMALAIRLGVPAITTDRTWAQIEAPGLEVILAR